MPKVIKGLEDRILAAARSRLLSGNLSSFSLRGVASDCGIAVGTIYNYYPDKESLMGAVMAQDWFADLSAIRREMEEAASLSEGVLCICEGIRRFSRSYEAIWNAYPAKAGFSTMFRKRHERLVRQITEELGALYQRFDTPSTPGTLVLIAETLIAAAQHADISDEDVLAFLHLQ